MWRDGVTEVAINCRAGHIVTSLPIDCIGRIGCFVGDPLYPCDISREVTATIGIMVKSTGIKMTEITTVVTVRLRIDSKIRQCNRTDMFKMLAATSVAQRRRTAVFRPGTSATIVVTRCATATSGWRITGNRAQEPGRNREVMNAIRDGVTTLATGIGTAGRSCTIVVDVDLAIAMKSRPLRGPVVSPRNPGVVGRGRADDMTRCTFVRQRPCVSMRPRITAGRIGRVANASIPTIGEIAMTVGALAAVAVTGRRRPLVGPAGAGAVTGGGTSRGGTLGKSCEQTAVGITDEITFRRAINMAAA